MAAATSDPLSAPRVALSGLSLLDVSWREQNGKMLVRGTIINISEFGWFDVVVSIRGLDQEGRLVVDGQYKISNISGRTTSHFSFQTTSGARPTRCEIVLIKGKR